MAPAVITSIPLRIAKLRDELFAVKSTFCFSRAEILTEFWQSAEGMPLDLRRAEALHRNLCEMPIFVRDGELLVGQRASSLGGRSVYPEFNLNGLDRRLAPPDVWTFWQERNLGASVRARHSEELRVVESELAAGYCTGTDSGFGHVIADYEKVLTLGFSGIIRQAKGLLASATEHDAGRFLEGVVRAAEAVIVWANRHAELAEDLAARSSDVTRRLELQNMAEICRKVPAEPAGTFHEALQSFWFTHLAVHIEQYGWSISAGRFDQYMYPFYQNDLETGRSPEYLHNS